MNYWTEVQQNNSKQIDELELENEQLKLENDELKKQTDQEIQKNKKFQSIQNTLVIIICLLIIGVLLGIGIYLYFKKQ